MWEMARIATEIGLPTNLECNSVVEEAARMASKLGHGFVQTHQEKVDQVPDKITLLKIIEMRRIYANYHDHHHNHHHHHPYLI